MLMGKAYLSIKPEMPGRAGDERCSTVTGEGTSGAVATDAPATGGVACHSSENGASGNGSSPNRGSSKTTSSPTVGGVACHSSENGASSGVTEPEKVRRRSPITSPGNQRHQHPGAHQDAERHQRKNVAEKLDLEEFKKNEGGNHPCQQQQVPPLSNAALPGEPRSDGHGQPRYDAQGNSQAPYRSLTQLVEKRRRVRVLPGKRKPASLAGHARLLTDIGDEIGEIQKCVGRSDEERGQRGRCGQSDHRNDSRDIPRAQFGPIAPGSILRDPDECEHEGGHDGSNRHLGSHRQADQRAQQRSVAITPRFDESKHGPQCRQ